MSIINLMFTTREIEAVDFWIIDQELSTMFDHKVIVCDLTNLDETVGGMGTSQEVTGRSIKTLSDEKTNETCKDWHQTAAERPRMGEVGTRQDMVEEAEWIESILTTMLDRHVTQIRVTAGSKRWWTPEAEGKHKEYGCTRKLYQQGKSNAFTQKAERNSYYYII